MKLEEALTRVWRQTLIENVNAVELEGRTYPVKRTSRHRLRQVDFEFEFVKLRGLEQHPDTNSRRAQLAREGMSAQQGLSGPGGPRF